MNNELVGIWPAEEKFANFTWQVSDVCNYKCSYCNPGNYGAKNKNIDVERYKSVLTQIINQFKNKGYSHFKFFFSGGEPTIWPPLIEICRHIKSLVPNATLAVNTNLSRPLSWWQQHYTLFDDVVASFHIESCDQNNYLKNIDFLQYRLNYLACRILMHDEKFTQVIEFSERIKKNINNCVIEYAGLFNELQPQSEMYYYKEDWKRDFIKNNSYFKKRDVDFSFLGTKNKAFCYEVYSDGEKKSLNATRLIGENATNFIGWKCWINDSIFIGPAGNIQLASCEVSKTIGNMNAGDVSLLDEPVICFAKNCGPRNIERPKRYA